MKTSESAAGDHSNRVLGPILSASQNFWNHISRFLWVALLFVHFGTVWACDCKTHKNQENPKFCRPRDSGTLKEQALGGLSTGTNLEIRSGFKKFAKWVRSKGFHTDDAASKF